MSAMAAIGFWRRIPGTVGLLAYFGLCALSPVRAATIVYEFGWTASGEIRNTTPFTDQPFLLTLSGNKSNVQSSAGGYVNETLLVTLDGPQGTTTVSDPNLPGTHFALGIQAPGPSQSIVYYETNTFNSIIDLAPFDASLFPGYSTYDLQGAFGPIGGPNLSGAFLADPGFGMDTATATDFTFEATDGGGDAISYRIGWTASGETTTVTPFTDAPFTLRLVGDTANVTSDSGNLFNESLSATLTGPAGTIVIDPFNMGIGLQPPGPAQSLILFALGSFNSVLELGELSPGSVPGFNTYDLQSSFGPFGSPELLGDFVSDPGFGFDIQTATNFTFRAVTDTAVSEPSVLAMLSLGLAGLGIARRRLRH